MKVFYNDQYVASKYAFDTTRKAQWVADRIKGFVEIVSPDTDSTEALIRRVQDAEYIGTLKTGEPRHLAESQGFEWDEGMWAAFLTRPQG